MTYIIYYRPFGGEVLTASLQSFPSSLLKFFGGLEYQFHFQPDGLSMVYIVFNSSAKVSALTSIAIGDLLKYYLAVISYQYFQEQ